MIRFAAGYCARDWLRNIKQITVKLKQITPKNGCGGQNPRSFGTLKCLLHSSGVSGGVRSCCQIPSWANAVRRCLKLERLFN